MNYVYKNYVYTNQDNKGILYKDKKILFMGNSWSGIMQFLGETDNAPEVRAMFKAQLEQREKIKYKLEQKEKVVENTKVDTTPTPPPPKPKKQKPKSIWDDNRRMTK